jgi:hypothetical protein
LLGGPSENTSEFTIGVTSAFVNSGPLEIVATGAGADLNTGDGLKTPELDVSAGTIVNTKSIIASAGMLVTEMPILPC